MTGLPLWATDLNLTDCNIEHTSKFQDPKGPELRILSTDHKPSLAESCSWFITLQNCCPSLLIGSDSSLRHRVTSAQGESSRCNGNFPLMRQVQSRECWGDKLGHTTSAVTNQEKDQPPLLLRESHSETCQPTLGPILYFLKFMESL